MSQSTHAQARAQQRGIPIEIIDLISKYGTPIHRPGNAIGYMVTKRQANGIIQGAKRFIHLIERSPGVMIIVDNDDREKLITVYHRK